MFICRAKWVAVLGTKYKVGATLHIGFDEDDFAAFWDIKKIFIINRNLTDLVFIVSGRETLRFNEHYQCYEVALPQRRNFKVAYAKDFTCYLPLNLVKPVGWRHRSKFVNLRYEIDWCTELTSDCHDDSPSISEGYMYLLGTSVFGLNHISSVDVCIVVWMALKLSHFDMHRSCM